jgi:hypothetical protein
VATHSGAVDTALLSCIIPTSRAAETHMLAYDDAYRVPSNMQATRGTLNYQYDAADRVSHMDIQGGLPTDSGRVLLRLIAAWLFRDRTIHENKTVPNFVRLETEQYMKTRPSPISS